MQLLSFCDYRSNDSGCLRQGFVLWSWSVQNWLFIVCWPRTCTDLSAVSFHCKIKMREFRTFLEERRGFLFLWLPLSSDAPHLKQVLSLAPWLGIILDIQGQCLFLISGIILLEIYNMGRLQNLVPKKNVLEESLEKMSLSQGEWY